MKLNIIATLKDPELKMLKKSFPLITVLTTLFPGFLLKVNFFGCLSFVSVLFCCVIKDPLVIVGG